MKEKNFFTPLYVADDYGKIELLTVKNSFRAIKKLKKYYSEKALLISHGEENEKIWKNRIKNKRGISYRTALPVLEKICRQAAEKHNIPIPLREIYIMANPAEACEITACLTGISKIFTVISPLCPLTTVYDELYFKHGTIIRQLPDFNNNLSEDSVIIRTVDDDLPLWAKIPVIDFSDTASPENLAIMPENIYVSDEKISALAEILGGKCGLGFYELIGEIPSVDAEVDINIAADKIFLLDTRRF